jgi:mannose-binding lectin
MSNGPVSGNGIALTVPTGKTAFWTVTTQAAWSQFVQLTDSAGNIVFSAAGASPDGHSPTQIGAGSFTAGDPGGNYRIYIGTNGGQSWSTVLWDVLPLQFNGTTMSGNYNFISEDGADQDFNDSCVTLTWFEQIG